MRIVWAIALLWILVWQLDAWQRLPAFWPHLASLQILLAIGLTVPIILCRALRWNLILRDVGRAFPAVDLAVAYGSSLFLGMVTPGKVGEGSRAWFARDRCHGSLSTAVFSVALDKILDVVPTLFGAVALLLAFRRAELVPSGPVWVALSLGLVFTTLLVLRPRTLQNSLARLARRASRNVSRRAAPATALAVVSGRTVLKALACSAALHALALGQSVLFALAAGISLSPWMLYGAICVGAVAAALPLSIGGLGSRELALIMVLAMLGVPKEAAVDFSLFHLANAIFTAMVTAPFLLAGRWRRTALEQS
jgi:uncharacterized protein (TIRG00374 family)